MPPFGPIERTDQGLPAELLGQAGLSREEWERL